MIYNIVSLLLEVATGLVAGAALLRAAMQYHRIPMSARSGNPLGPFLFALTDWLVLPLRRVVGSVGRIDLSCLVAAFLLELAQFVLLWLLTGMAGSAAMLPVLAVFGLARLVISALTALVIIYAVLSWAPGSPVLSDLVTRLVAPWLAPVRRVLPLVGGVDLSPLVLLVLTQIAGILLGHVQGAVLPVFAQ